MTTRETHLDLFRRALELEFRDDVREAFLDMLSRLTTRPDARCSWARAARAVFWTQDTLIEAQERWVRTALGEELPPPDTRLTSGDISRGHEVAMPAVLRNLPKAPPGRRP